MSEGDALYHFICCSLSLPLSPAPSPSPCQREWFIQGVFPSPYLFSLPLSLSCFLSVSCLLTLWSPALQCMCVCVCVDSGSVWGYIGSMARCRSGGRELLLCQRFPPLAPLFKTTLCVSAYSMCGIGTFSVTVLLWCLLFFSDLQRPINRCERQGTDAHSHRNALHCFRLDAVRDSHVHWTPNVAFSHCP